MKDSVYVGLHADDEVLGPLGRVVLDAWVFGLIDPSEDCRGWDAARMQALMRQVEGQWDRHGGLPSRLPEPLRRRHAELYAWAIERARARGWSAELDDDE